MSLIETIFGKSPETKAREQAERFYLAGKITEKEYLKLLDEIELNSL